jgi:hypothetical protein
MDAHTDEPVEDSQKKKKKKKKSTSRRKTKQAGYAYCSCLKATNHSD